MRSGRPGRNKTVILRRSFVRHHVNMSNAVVTGNAFPPESKKPRPPRAPETAGSHQNTPLPSPKGVACTIPAWMKRKLLGNWVAVRKSRCGIPVRIRSSRLRKKGSEHPKTGRRRTKNQQLAAVNKCWKRVFPQTASLGEALEEVRWNAN